MLAVSVSSAGIRIGFQCSSPSSDAMQGVLAMCLCPHLCSCMIGHAYVCDHNEDGNSNQHKLCYLCSDLEFASSLSENDSPQSLSTCGRSAHLSGLSQALIPCWSFLIFFGHLCITGFWASSQDFLGTAVTWKVLWRTHSCSQSTCTESGRVRCTPIDMILTPQDSSVEMLHLSVVFPVHRAWRGWGRGTWSFATLQHFSANSSSHPSPIHKTLSLGAGKVSHSPQSI